MTAKIKSSGATRHFDDHGVPAALRQQVEEEIKQQSSERQKEPLINLSSESIELLEVIVEPVDSSGLRLQS